MPRKEVGLPGRFDRVTADGGIIEARLNNVVRPEIEAVRFLGDSRTPQAKPLCSTETTYFTASYSSDKGVTTPL